MRSVVMKTLGLVASVVLCLTACGGAWSIYTRLRRDAGAIKHALEDEEHRRKSTLLLQG